ncbi:MAG: hypothetical protein M2R45_04805 [Verrucomicrobia subdivision 3 bacterium]|nr:hypothetical protein [Limisphaerales bacterium]MCS1417449.1 hypothetical protein [Limisphaerales bacterium]
MGRVWLPGMSTGTDGATFTSVDWKEITYSIETWEDSDLKM